MRIVEVSAIERAVYELCLECNTRLSIDMERALIRARDEEKGTLAKEVLAKLVDNLDMAKSRSMPICQDTGLVVIFVDIGREVFLDGNLDLAVNKGIKEAYKDGYFRNSACSPLLRENTGDNTPGIIHLSLVDGDSVDIYVAPKGFGSENMGGLKMLKPSDGVEGVIDYVVEVVANAGPNACPPLIVGVGIGGTMEKASLMAKRSLIRPIDIKNKDPRLDELEGLILQRINRLGIGAMGYGGKITALRVLIEEYPTHIAGLPVAVNLNCHVARHGHRRI